MSVSAGYYLGLANFTGESDVTGTHNSIWTLFIYSIFAPILLIGEM